MIQEHVEGLKVPHMGWNELTFRPTARFSTACRRSRRSTSFTRIMQRRIDPQLTAAEADYPSPFTAAVWKDNLYATQFHPEKSQQVGLTMLKNFAEL